MNILYLSSLLQPLLLASSLASASESASAVSTRIRGSPRQGQQSNGLSPNHHHHHHHRRLLLKESSCTLFRKCATYGPTDEHPHGHEEHSWVCKLSNEDSKQLGNLYYVDVVESPALASILEDATTTTGSSIMTVSDAVVDIDNPRMYIPENAHVRIRNNNRLDHDRLDQTERGATSTKKGPPTTGKLRTLVLRITDGNNVSVTASLDQLKNDIFDDGASLKTQTEACSYDKLEIEPFRGNTPNNNFISNGVVDVSMDFVMASDPGGYVNSAIAAANQLLGDLQDPMFDLVMMCFPPGSKDTNFIASAQVNDKFSFYNDKWCSYVSAQMHEVGHNLGLDHSGETGGTQLDLGYGDVAGIMGYSSGVDDQKICYNPQKNYQLGWYDNKVRTIDPLDGAGSREFTLNGVSDYQKNNNALVVLRLKQSNILNKDYYIGFNRADGINKDTREDKNMVTIVRKNSGLPDEFGSSTKIASLNPGERYVIKDYDGVEDVQILFLGLSDGDATIAVLNGDCQEFSIQVTTDNYPEDTSWTIIDTGDIEDVAETSPVYNEKLTTTVQQVCLPMGTKPKTYKFTIYDKYTDGLTNGGKGSYKIIDDRGKVIVFKDEGKFKERVHEIKVRKAPNPPKPTTAPTKAPTANPTTAPTQKPTPTPSKPPTENPTPTPSKPPTRAPVTNPDQSPSGDGCEDKMMEKEKFELKEGGRKNTCKFYNKRNKCDEKISTGTPRNKFVWEVCEKSCNRCGGGSPSSSQSSSSSDDDECKDETKGKRRFRIKEDGRKNTCSFFAKRNKCDETIATGKNVNKQVWEICKNSCNRC